MAHRCPFCSNEISAGQRHDCECGGYIAFKLSILEKRNECIPHYVPFVQWLTNQPRRYLAAVAEHETMFPRLLMTHDLLVSAIAELYMATPARHFFSSNYTSEPYDEEVHALRRRLIGRELLRPQQQQQIQSDPLEPLVEPTQPTLSLEDHAYPFTLLLDETKTIEIQDCAICYEVMTPENVVTVDVCQHQFCVDCVVQQLKTKQSPLHERMKCALCRRACLHTLIFHSEETRRRSCSQFL